MRVKLFVFLVVFFFMGILPSQADPGHPFTPIACPPSTYSYQTTSGSYACQWYAPPTYKPFSHEDDPDINNGNPLGSGDGENESTTCSQPLPLKANPFRANPINVITGNKFIFEQDIVLQGPGISPNISRYKRKRTFHELKNTQNARNLTSPMFGYEWSMNYDWKINVPRNYNATGYISIIRGDGRKLFFKRNYDGSITSTSGVAGVLKCPSQNTCVYTNARNRQYMMTRFYSNQYHLSKIMDPDGSFLDLIYDGNARLQKVSASNGHFLTFSYHNWPNEKYTKTITDTAGRVWSYAYDYDQAQYFGGISSVTFPGHRIKKYHMDFVHPAYRSFMTSTSRTIRTVNDGLITGITGFDNIKQGIYDYDYSTRAASSEAVGGVGKISVHYSVNRVPGVNQVTDSLNRVTTYKTKVVAGHRMVSSITGPSTTCGHDSYTAYTYDSKTNMLSETHEDNTTYYGGHDQFGNPGYIIDPTGFRTELGYDPVFHQINYIAEPSVLQGQKKMTFLTYNTNSAITQINIQGFHPNGTAISRTINMEYKGPFAQLSRVIGAQNNALATSVMIKVGTQHLTDGVPQTINDTLNLMYYANDPIEGNNRARLKQIMSSGVILKNNIRYSTTGKIIYAEYPINEGRNRVMKVDYSYDPNTDQLMSKSSIAFFYKTITEYSYTPVGQLKSITKRAGYNWGGNFSEYISVRQTDSFQYDDAHRLIRHTLGNNSYIEYTHDTESNITQETHMDAAGNILKKISRSYDANNHLNLLRTGDIQLNYDYRADGLISKLVNINSFQNKQTDYRYLKGELTSITRDASNMAATSTYDNHLNRVTGVTDPIQNKTTYQYDDLGNAVEELSPDSGRTEYRYNQAGNIIWRKNAMGTVTNYLYDAFNRLAKVDYPGVDEDEYYAYYNNGKLNRTTKKDVSTGYTYDEFGHLTLQNTIIASRIYFTSFQYYPNGFLSNMRYPSGDYAIFYPHPTHKQKIGIVYHINTKTWAWNYIESSDYNSLGDIRTRYRSNGLSESYTYQPDTGLPLDFKLKGIAEFNLFWQHGEIKLISDLLNPSSFGSVLYDSLGQLQQMYAPNPFDLNGNNANTWCAKNIGNNQINNCTYGSISTTYGYDLSGKTTSKTTNAFWLSQPIIKSYAYGFDERLRSVSNDYSYNFGGQTVSYSNLISSYDYNVFGQRASKSIHGSGTRHFIYGLNGELIGEYDANTGKRVAEYIYNSTGRTATVTDTGQIYHHFNNHLGMTQVLTDANQKVVWKRLGYNLKFNLNQGLSDPDHDGIRVENNFGFPGQYYDAGTGLSYNWNRYYDPDLGRYTRPDPIGLNGGLNPYRYAGNNPMMFSDPTGLDASYIFNKYGTWEGYKINVTAGIIAKRKALKATKVYYDKHYITIKNQKGSANGGVGDAIRHCVWSCEMTKMLGGEVARDIGEMHERDGISSEMDTRNNQIGCWLGDNAGINQTCQDICFEKKIFLLLNGWKNEIIPVGNQKF